MLAFKKTAGVVTLILLGQLILSILAGTSLIYGVDQSKAPEGFAIWGKNLSGLTKEEALVILEREMPDAVSYQEKVYPIETSQSRLVMKDWLSKQYPHSNKLWLIDAVNYIKRWGKVPQSPQMFVREEILPQLHNLAIGIDQEGKPAKIHYNNGELILEPGQENAKLDIEASWTAIQQSQGEHPVPLVVQALEVHPSTAELQQVKDKLGDFTTYFNSNLRERVNNVQLAAKAIDGLLIPPGAEFSFNGTVGKRERETGYLPALMFIDNKVVLDDGGGICQDSSTLYQAVRQANLQILERNSHSLPVSYVPMGQDATVAYGLLDFRFKNDTLGYLLISAKTGNNWIRIRLFGVSDEKHLPLAAPDGFPTKPADWVKDPK